MTRLTKTIKTDIKSAIRDIDKALDQSQQSPTVHIPMVAIQTLDALVPLP